MIIRIALAAIAVAAIGVMTGTIHPSELLARIPHPGHQDNKAAYLDLVEGDFTRLRPLNEAFLGGCRPDPGAAGTCYALSEQMLNALHALQIDLNGASVPASFEGANTTLKLAVADGIEGFTQVQRAVRTHRRAQWLHARESLRASNALLEQAFEQLPTAEQPQNWGY